VPFFVNCDQRFLGSVVDHRRRKPARIVQAQPRTDLLKQTPVGAAVPDLRSSHQATPIAVIRPGRLQGHIRGDFRLLITDKGRRRPVLREWKDPDHRHLFAEQCVAVTVGRIETQVASATNVAFTWMCLTGELVREHVRATDLRRSRKQLGSVSHQRFSDSSLQMRLAAGFLYKRIKHGKGVFVEAHGKPGRGARFCIYEVLSTGEEGATCSSLPGFALSSTKRAKRVIENLRVQKGIVVSRSLQETAKTQAVLRARRVRSHIALRLSLRETAPDAPTHQASTVAIEVSFLPLDHNIQMIFLAADRPGVPLKNEVFY
jgi:hypothetical protein